MTERLYYTDSHLCECTSTVLKIKKYGEKTAVILDRTVFFPEGGGQKSDEGYIGAVKISETVMNDGEILHITDGECNLHVGEKAVCKINFDLRFMRMQAHSGEHIVSGLVHSLFGYENVGFHMDDALMTVDFSGYLTPRQLKELEEKANDCVYKNTEITAFFPSKEQLSALMYRSKREIENDVRLVKIEGVDLCACCAPHVSRTGEIGIIKILTAVSHRGGVRITLICGREAYKNFCEKYDHTLFIADLLCARHSETHLAVEALVKRNEELKRALNEQKLLLADYIADNCRVSEKNIVIFCGAADTESLREISIKCKEKCRGVCAVLSGSDKNGYSYAISSAVISPNKIIKQINAALKGRGGGRDELVQGKFEASRTEIEAFFEKFEVSAL